MLFAFSKWQGAGNDFILIEDWDETFPTSSIQKLCHRNYGIGADGLLLMQKGKKASLKMRYFNADGKEVAMCGNGLRCFFRYALSKGYCEVSAVIETLDSLYPCSFREGKVAIDFGIPETIASDVTCQGHDSILWVKAGVPHLVLRKEALECCDVKAIGKALRHDPQFAPEGVNVNLVEVMSPQALKVRTYERGVEAETLACGTGMIASAFVAKECWGLGNSFRILPRSEQEIEVEVDERGHYHLIGEAEQTFVGMVEVLSE